MLVFYKILLTIVILSLISSVLLAQVKSVYDKMSLDELLNIDVVVTASKHPEDLFETPLSVTIIKKDEISNSGVLSIPEALRLSPGLIVREITPGNFDIHIRGFDDITKNAYLSLPYNTTTLVMIDNRIVYSYFTGGTFWETFPVDLNDIERIEVVRGPASALYGPNAVTGVINIITTNADKKGMNVFVNGSAGNKQAQKASANIGYNWNDKTKLSFSGNFTEQHRFNAEYFNHNTEEYCSINDLTMTLFAVKNESTRERWSFQEYQAALGADYETEISLRKLGGNIFFFRRFSEKSNIDLAMGAQKSQSQKTGFLNFATALSQVNSESYYLNARLKINNFNGQINLHSGQDLNNYQFNSYRFTNIDGNLDYFKQFKNFSVRPGITYKHATYNSPVTYNEPFSLTTLNYQFKDEPRTISSYAVSLLTEWKPTAKLRLIGAARVDKFNINKNHSINYEFGTTYRINKNNLVRYVHSSATRSPFVFDTYLNCSFKLNMDYPGETNEAPINVPIDLSIRANRDLKYPTIINHEISWRTKFNPKLSLDVELFHSGTKNFVVSNFYREVLMVHQLNSVGEMDSINSIRGIGEAVFENFDIRAQQNGISFTLNYNPGDKINAKIFGTFQNTRLSGRTEIEFISTDLKIGEVQKDNTRTVKMNSFTNPTHWSEKLTPACYGGFYVNYKPVTNWSFSTDAYVYTNQRFIDYDFNIVMADYTGVYTSNFMDIKANAIVNAKATYRINKNTTSNITLKNILGRHREFGFADQIGTLFLIGLQWEL